MRIPINLPWVYSSTSNPEENAVVLRHLMECLIAIDMEYLRRHRTSPLFQSGVRYGRTFDWDTVPAVQRLGYGDCKSLSAWLCAEMRLRGEKCRPLFRSYPSRFGAPDFHIWVETAHGEIDPSEKLGMRGYLRDAKRLRRAG